VVVSKGRRFGQLTVRRKVASNRFGNARWECKCDCGNTHPVLAKNLRDGSTRSCGCGHRLRPYEHLYKRLLWRGEKFGIPVGISYEEFLPFVKVKECYYCGNPIEWTAHKYTKTTTSAYNLDRLKNNKGYILDNLVVCCRRCNLSRGHFTPEEWKVMMSALKQYQSNRSVQCQ